MQRDDALGIVRDFLPMVTEYADHLQIAGSIRREKVEVGDAEIVFMGAPLLWDRLDMLVHQGKTKRMVYRRKNGSTYNIWGGDLRRVLWHRGLKIEMYRAFPHSWGYILWLRTGPGDMNTWLMSTLKFMDAPLRFEGGEGVHIDAEGRRHVLHLPDEATLWRVLGMPEIPPKWRTVETLASRWNETHWARADIHEYLAGFHKKDVGQMRLF